MSADGTGVDGPEPTDEPGSVVRTSTDSAEQAPRAPTDEPGAVGERSVGLTTRIRTLASELGREIRSDETEPGPVEDHLDAAVGWLYRSQDVTDVGGSAATYNLLLGWADPYPETTGYIVPTLYEYADATDAPDASDRAERMADWLVDVQLDAGGFPAGVGAGGEPSVFNTGQILLGLCRAHEETGDERYRIAVHHAGTWLVSVQHEDGYWDRYDYNGVVHSYSARVGWALLEAAVVTGDESFLTAAERNLRWVRTQQRETGWFERAGFDQGEDPFLHTLAYTIRGLLEGGVLLDDAELVSSARRSADALLEKQRTDGTLPGRLDETFDGPSFHCLPGNAQMAVVWYRLFELTGQSKYRDGADRTVAFLQRKQRLDGPPGVRGGLSGSAPVWQRYMYLRYPNWGAKFLADALLLAGAVPRPNATERPISTPQG